MREATELIIKLVILGLVIAATLEMVRAYPAIWVGLQQ